MIKQNVWSSNQRISLHPPEDNLPWGALFIHRGCTLKAGSRKEGLKGIPRCVDPFQGARQWAANDQRGGEKTQGTECLAKGWGRVEG